VRNAPENLVTRTSEADPAQQQKIDTILRGTLSVGVDRDLLATAGNFSGFASYSFEGSSRHRACPPDIVHVVDFLKRQFTFGMCLYGLISRIHTAEMWKLCPRRVTNTYYQTQIHSQQGFERNLVSRRRTRRSTGYYSDNSERLLDNSRGPVRFPVHGRGH